MSPGIDRGFFLALLFRSIVASFATLEAIVLAVFAEPDIMRAVAKKTIFITLAFVFGLLANTAMEAFRHG